MKKDPKILLGHILESIEEIEKYKKHPKIAWVEIAGMRDVLIHDYFGVNINVVWKTIQEDIPFLKSQVKNLINGLT